METMILFSLIIIIIIFTLVIFINMENKIYIDMSIYTDVIVERLSFTEDQALKNKWNKENNYKDTEKWTRYSHLFEKLGDRYDYKIKPYYLDTNGKIYFYLQHKNLYSEVCISYDTWHKYSDSYIKPCKKKDLKCKTIKV